MRKYIKESLKYLLRTRLFIHKYMDEINAMYDMTPEELRERNERRFLKIFRKAYFRFEYYRRLCLAERISSKTTYNMSASYIQWQTSYTPFVYHSLNSDAIHYFPHQNKEYIY